MFTHSSTFNEWLANTQEKSNFEAIMLHAKLLVSNQSPPVNLRIESLVKRMDSFNVCCEIRREKLGHAIEELIHVLHNS
jgi:hypothetical protein